MAYQMICSSNFDDTGHDKSLLIYGVLVNYIALLVQLQGHPTFQLSLDYHLSRFLYWVSGF